MLPQRVYVELEEISCGKCGITFAMPATTLSERRECGQEFYCPNGHNRIFRESENIRRRRG